MKHLSVASKDLALKEARTLTSGFPQGMRERRETSRDIGETSRNFGEISDADDEDELEHPQEHWPDAHPAMLQGFAGRFVQTVSPHSETDPLALLLTFLVFFGHVATSSAHCVTEADRQTGALFACLVGKSSRGRKGTSLSWIAKLFDYIRHYPDSQPLPEYQTRMLHGLASGEGLIERMKDQEGQARDLHRERLLIIDSEFASTLSKMKREGNVISANLRLAWDGKALENARVANPTRVSHPHVSLLAHITQAELSQLFGNVDVFNGLGNRFLWVCVRRSKSFRTAVAWVTMSSGPWGASSFQWSTQLSNGSGWSSVPSLAGCGKSATRPV